MGLRSLVLLAALVAACSALIRIPLKKFPSMRSIYNEVGTDIPDLIELGQVLKYKFGGPGATNPTPEALKNYMDVSIVADLSSSNGSVQE
ncbi:hypothetical protein lerEdw1_005307 [Lerista edwardsae]|nr:hypothetical protein lerEdw1_005307 [Lerista edwardsae]